MSHPGGVLNIMLRGGDPATEAGYEDAPPRMGFFTDTSVCIGCKACEVACKEWNGVPEDGLNWTGWSHDNSQGLSADTWRHVAFIEQRVPLSSHVTNFQRDDDSEETIRHRLEVYADQTSPLIGYYGDRGLLRGVDATGPVEDVTERAINALRRFGD